MKRYHSYNKLLCLISASAAFILVVNITIIEQVHHAQQSISTENHGDEYDVLSEEKKYHNWTINEMDEYFKCKDDKPLIPQSAWINARKTYASQPSQSHNLLPDPGDNGFSVPVEGRKATGKGRGVFALRDIKKGELVWNPKQTARFATGKAYRDFIFSLDEEFVCDALMFSYVQGIENSHGDGGINKISHKDPTQLIILIDLDEGGLCNDAYYGEMNIGCYEELLGNDYEGGCQMNYFALRDIKAGDELICDYSSFVADARSWNHFGL